jgi:MFS family permease
VDEQRATGFRGAWRHRRWRWLLGSYAISTTGDFLYSVALVVVLIEDTGSAGWVAAAAVLRVVAYVVLGPFGGAIADRFDRRRLMVWLDLGRFVVMGAVAAVIWADGAAAVVVALTVVNSVLTVPYRSAAVAATPHVVDEDDLAAANAAEGVIGQVAFFAGPALGALVVAVADPAVAFAVNGATFAVSALLLGRAGSLGGRQVSGSEATTGASDADADDDGDAEQSIWRDVLDGGREVVGSAGLVALMVITGIVMFQVGGERVLHVLVAQDLVGRDADWVGVMGAALGVGGLVVAPFVGRLGATSWSGALLAASGVLIGAPLALLGVVHSSVGVLALLGVQGVGVMVFEVAFITLLQRWCNEAAIARVFGLNDSLTAVTEIVGAVLAPVLVAAAGVETALVVMGLVVVVGSAATTPVLHREAKRSEARRRELVPIVEQLGALGIFEGASRSSLERIAAAVREVTVAAGSTVFDEGDAADDLYIVRSGEFAASSAAAGDLSTMGRGDWFGEIGLLRTMPRTATVRAVTPSTAWAVDGRTFAAALAGPLQAQGLLHGTMTARLGRTHPGVRFDAAADV